MVITLLMGALVLRTDKCHTVYSIERSGSHGLLEVHYGFINKDGENESARFTYDGKRQSLVIGTSFEIL